MALTHTHICELLVCGELSERSAPVERTFLLILLIASSSPLLSSHLPTTPLPLSLFHSVSESLHPRSLSSSGEDGLD